VAERLRQPGRDDHGRDAHAEPGEVEIGIGRAKAVGVGDVSWRHDVVVEAAVLVVGDDQDRRLPQFLVRAERLVDATDQTLTGRDVAGGVL
jgi:hypothetical protein